jgi:hypothetical protein
LIFHDYRAGDTEEYFLQEKIGKEGWYFVKMNSLAISFIPLSCEYVNIVLFCEIWQHF